MNFNQAVPLSGSPRMQIWRALTCFGLLIAGASSSSISADEAADYPIGDFPDSVTDLAYEPKSGRLAIVGPWTQAVGVLDLDEPQVRPKLADQITLISTQGKPTSVAWAPLDSTPKWVIGQQSPNSLLVVDVESGKVDKTFRLGTAYPHLVSRSLDPQSSLILAFLVPQAGRDGENTTVDLRTGEQTKLSSSGISRLTTDCQCIFSGSDRLFVPDHRGIAKYRGPILDDMTFVLTPWPDQLVTGNTVFSDQSSRDLTFQPWVFLEGPWCAGFERHDLVVGSALDSTEVARLPLPDDWFPQAVPNRFQSPGILGREGARPSLFLFSDPTRKVLVVASNRQLAIVPWGHLPLTQDFNLKLKVPPAREAQVGVEYRVPLQTTAGQPEIELQLAPPGMTCVDQELRWTPEFDQVGQFPVRLKITAEDRTHWESWKVQVRQRRLKTSFAVRDADISEDGRWAVLWGGKFQKPSTQLAVFDLSNETLVQEVTREFPIQDAVITRDAVVLSEIRENVDSLGRMPLVKLSRETLAMEQQSFVTPGDLVAMGDDQLFVMGQERFPGLTANYVDLSRVQISDLTEQESLATQEAVQRTAEGWIHSGALWSSDGTTPLMLLAPNTRSVPQGAGLLESERGYRLFPLVSRLSSVHAPNSRFSPFGHQLRLLDEYSGGKDTLAIGDRFDLRPRQTVRLMAEGEEGLSPKEAVQLRFFANQALAVYGGVAFVVPLPVVNTPVRLRRKQSTLTLNSKGETTVRYEADGATRYEIRFPFANHATLQSESGTFHIQLEKVFGERWKSMTDPTMSGLRNGPAPPPADNSPAARFRRLVGRAPDGSPLEVIVIVTAYGPGLSKDSMEHAYFVDIPMTKAAR